MIEKPLWTDLVVIACAPGLEGFNPEFGTLSTHDATGFENISNRETMRLKISIDVKERECLRGYLTRNIHYTNKASSAPHH